MIDMNQVNPADRVPQQPTQAPSAPYQDVGGGQNIIQPMPGQGQPYAPAPGQNYNIAGNQISGLPDPVDNLYKWADYGQGARPPEWTYQQFPEQAQQAWQQMGSHIYRDPSWPGHMVWNPYWGFMNYGALVDQLEGGYTGGLQDMPGFTRLGENWWSEYTPQDIYGPGVTEWPGSQPGGGGGGGGGGGDDSASFPWEDWMNYGGDQSDVPGQYWSEPYAAPEGQGYQYPWQWGVAGTSEPIRLLNGRVMKPPNTLKDSLGQQGACYDP